jgi:hypothetical protein
VFTPSVGVKHFWVDLDGMACFAPTPNVGVMHMWVVLAFLNSITKNRITPTNSNDARNEMVIINLSLLQYVTEPTKL